jgi:hypothetical protein
MHERIAINPKVCHGQACVKGTRIPVTRSWGVGRFDVAVDEFVLMQVFKGLRQLDSQWHAFDHIGGQRPRLCNCFSVVNVTRSPVATRQIQTCAFAESGQGGHP